MQEYTPNLGRGNHLNVSLCICDIISRSCSVMDWSAWVGDAIMLMDWSAWLGDAIMYMVLSWLTTRPVMERRTSIAQPDNVVMYDVHVLFSKTHSIMWQFLHTYCYSDILLP